MTMKNKKGNVTILTVTIALLVFVAVFFGMNLFVGEYMTANNVTAPTGYNTTYTEVQQIAEDYGGNQTIEDLEQITSEDLNVSGSTQSNEETMFEIAMRYGSNIVGIVPKTTGLINSMGKDLGVNPTILGILATMVIATVGYVSVVFLRRGS